jgi:hypothetical protein
MTSAGVDRIFTIRGLLTQKLQTLRLKKKRAALWGSQLLFSRCGMSNIFHPYS